MRLPPTPSPLRQDLSANPLEVPLETHLRSLILRNNPHISTSQFDDSSRPSNGDLTDAASPANLPALPPKGTRAQRNDAPTTQGMAYHRFENPQPQQNRPGSVSRTNRSQDIHNPTGQVAPAAYSFTPPLPRPLHRALMLRKQRANALTDRIVTISNKLVRSIIPMTGRVSNSKAVAGT